nr:MAG TPA: hypothetical protein [Bacteriophage sp.]
MSWCARLVRYCTRHNLPRLDGLQCYNYIFRHCKRLVLWRILAHSIKSTLTRFKTLKTSNTRLKCVYHKIIEYFCLFVNVLQYPDL